MSFLHRVVKRSLLLGVSVFGVHHATKNQESVFDMREEFTDIFRDMNIVFAPSSLHDFHKNLLHISAQQYQFEVRFYEQSTASAPLFLMKDGEF